MNLTHEEIQQEELMILKNFRDFCEEYNLYFSLVGGTLLGAVRHHGFIPWDDDIDVCMPRPDYERFITLFPRFAERTGYRLEGFAKTKKDPLFFKIINPAIAVQDAADRRTSENYLWIDLFPCDGLPETPEEIQIIYSKAAHFRNVVWMRNTKWTFGKSIVKKIGKCLLGPLVILFRLDKICEDRLYSLARQRDFSASDTVGCITWGMYGSGEALPKKEFLTPEYLLFCGEKFPVFSCWDRYLSGIYGDYMTPPPAAEQVAHGLQAWYIDM